MSATITTRDSTNHIAATEVTIGTQTWMLRNIDDSISGSKVYNDDENNRPIYGGLYGYDMIGAIEALHPGWHVPDDNEWETLKQYLGGYAVSGGKLKETGTTHWNTPNGDADNSSGFTGLGGGAWRSDTGYNYLKAYGWFLSSTYWPDTYETSYYSLNATDGGSNHGYAAVGLDMYYSVRLIKD